MRFRTTTDSKRTLAAAAICFVAAQVLFNVVADLRHPELFDAEYGVRLALLRERQAETPRSPLLLMLGSSRTVHCFEPEILPELRTAAGARVLSFNFSHLAAGPVMNLMEYRRLRRAGVRPSWLVMEVMPPCLSLEKPGQATGCATALDLPVLQRYFERPKLFARFCQYRLLPWHRHRNDLVHRFAPDWAAPGSPTEKSTIHLGPLGGDDHWVMRATETADCFQRAKEAARADYYPRLQDFSIKESTTRAYGELIATCHKDGTQVVLLLTPEGTEFRSWYSADALRQIDDWCATMRRTYGVQIVDARTWVADGDFLDTHHVMCHGADVFTKRFCEEVLVPLVRGETNWTDGR